MRIFGPPNDQINRFAVGCYCAGSRARNGSGVNKLHWAQRSFLFVFSRWLLRWNPSSYAT